MFERDLVLPESQRGAFKEPIGREMDEGELDNINAQTCFITVGDVVSLTFRRHGVRPLLSEPRGEDHSRDG